MIDEHILVATLYDRNNATYYTYIGLCPISLKNNVLSDWEEPDDNYHHSCIKEMFDDADKDMSLGQFHTKYEEEDWEMFISRNRL